MLGAAKRGPRFTINLKRSTHNLQPSTSRTADYPIFVPKADIDQVVFFCQLFSKRLIQKEPVRLRGLVKGAAEVDPESDP